MKQKRLLTMLVLLAAVVSGAWAQWTGGTHTATANENLNAINVSDDATLTINQGVTVTVNGGITVASGKTLTVNGGGTLVANGANGANGDTNQPGNAGGTAIAGNVIINGVGLTVTATGGQGGQGGQGYAGDNGYGDYSGGQGDQGSTGGNGGYAFSDAVTIYAGSVTANGGTGGRGGQGGKGGKGGDGDMFSTGAYGGNGGWGGQGGYGGYAFAGTLTVFGGNVTAYGGAGGAGGFGGDGGDGGLGTEDPGESGEPGDVGDDGGQSNAYASNVTFQATTYTMTDGTNPITDATGKKTVIIQSSDVLPAPAGYTVTLAEGTEDADKWTVKVGEGEAQAFPVEGLEGETVTVTYTGTKRVKSVKAVKEGGAEPVDNTYLKWDADQKKLVATDIPAEVTTVENANQNIEWAAGTYVVEGDVTISGIIKLNGNVDLIIKDGAKLTVTNQIVGYDKNLSIYGQANQTGQLVVNYSGHAITNVTTLEVHSCQVKATSSGNSCGGFYYIQTFNVYGGSVDAESTAAKSGYGISMYSMGSMNIYGGDVKALGKGNKYGIRGSESTITVYGGKLWAENAGNKAIDASNVTLTKGAGFTGKIETSGDGESWTEYTEAGTPETRYVRAGY